MRDVESTATRQKIKTGLGPSSSQKLFPTVYRFKRSSSTYQETLLSFFGDRFASEKEGKYIEKGSINVLERKTLAIRVSSLHPKKVGEGEKQN